MLWKRSEDFRCVINVALGHDSVNGSKVNDIDRKEWAEVGIGIGALSDVVCY